MVGRRIDLSDEVSTKNKKAEPTVAPKTMSADEFLNSVGLVSTTKPVGTKVKNGIRTLSPSEKLRRMVDEITDWKREEKQAKAERETREEEIINWVQTKQEEDGFKGDYQKSYYVAGIENVVTFVSSDRFTPPKPEDIEELTDILGDKFNEFITKNVTVNLKPSVMADKALLDELKAYIPKEEMGKFFEAQTVWGVVNGFDKKRFTLPKRIFEKVSRIIKQAKPGIK